MQTGIVIKSEYFLFALFVISIYFSTSLSTILSVFIGLQWLFSGRFMALPRVLRCCPVALWALLLFGSFIVGLTYNSATLQEGLAMVNKYRELFFIPVLMGFVSTERFRYWLWNAFIIASIATLLGSSLMDAGVLELNKLGDPCFKSRITHSIFIAFFAFFCAHKAFQEQRYRPLYLIAMAFCLYNLFFVVQGRTGQLVIIGLALLFAWQRFSGKGRLLAIVVIASLLALFVNFSDKTSRLKEGIENTQAYLKPVPEQVDSSMGLRYGFWKNSLILMSGKPLLGYGTGSFTKEYQHLVGDKEFATTNPHNEFLMIGVQLGVLGVLVYVGFLWSQFQCARQLAKPEKWLAQGLLLCLLITSVFNSPFLDHAEGHWFAVLIALCFAPIYKPGVPPGKDSPPISRPGL